MRRGDEEFEIEPSAETRELVASVRSRAVTARTSPASGLPEAGTAGGVATRRRYREAVAASIGKRYDVTDVIEEGSVLALYVARDLRHGRAVTLQVNPVLAKLADPERVRAALASAATLSHPNILPVYDFDVMPNIVFYATAPLNGQSLRERLERERPLPIGDAVRIACETAAALAHASERGVRHGDLRPKHILLRHDGVAVSSFALVDALGKPEGASVALTIGTPEYLSPEQLAGQGQAAGWSDLYSLGCVLYEMLAGESPFASPIQSLVVTRSLVALRRRRLD